MKKRGSAIMVAVILGSVFFVVVSGLLRYSSSEMKHVKAISAVRKAELLALSGVDWAESELRKGRWYQKEFQPYEKVVGVHPTHGVKELNPFGSDEGKVTVVCEDVANAMPGSNVRGMQRLWYLHHINVYALGEFEGAKALVYGRYIISPEPALNSTSTEASEYESPEYGAPRAAALRILPAMLNGADVNDFIVKKIFAAANQSVDINSVVATLVPANGSTGEISLRPQTNGRISEILLEEGQTCRAGDTFAVLSRQITTAGGIADSKTLKKMVRVTKIDPRIWHGLSILSRTDRFALSQYISGLSDAYLQNFVAHASLESAISNLGGNKLNNKLSAEELLAKFPADVNNTTRNRAENMFLANMIQNFTVPGGTWERKEKSLDKTYLELDHPRTTQPPADLINWLRDLNLTFLLNTKPRLDPRYYEPKMKQSEFIKLLKPQFNVDPAQFIQSLSQLSDASRYVDIVEGDFENATPVFRETDASIEIVKPEKNVRVFVEKYTKDYTFVDPESGFSIKMGDLMTFLRKYYDDTGSQSPREDVRTLEHTDWPLPKPAPEPPSARPGGTWVWNPGTPGTPPGDPTWSHRNGAKKLIPSPVGGERDFEPAGGPPDGGEKSYRVAAIAPTSSKSSTSHGGNTVEPVNSQFSNVRPPIEIETGGTWNATPGSPGVDPTEGSYSWRENPPPPENSSDQTTRKCTTCCFAAGTMILMADSSLRAIEEVTVGDKVAAYDESGKTRVTGEVMALESPERDHLTTLTFADGKTLRLTDEHPLYARNGWASVDPGFTFDIYKMQTGKLRAGAEVFGSDDDWHKIVAISTVLSDTKVYNLSKVEPGQTFFADGILAHNKPVCQCEVCKPGGGGEAGGNENATSGAPGSGSSGSATDNTATGQPGGADGGANTADGTGNNPGAGGSGTSTSGGPGSAGGQANTSGGNSTNTPGSSGNPGGSSSNNPGGSSPGGSGSTHSGGGSTSTGNPGSSGGGSIATPYTPPRRTGGGF
ncbi:MAG: hypothetical protein CVV41_17750 [Candidatus Riflebacteria bacterium HGW-Riflebacteria-1]|jgi:hypothetical protein|nr:MAG: hypothetical protein CVV41_17750 [Candidatus Riflebacteria bacterium HGW-Riflebacteria-1]